MNTAQRVMKNTGVLLTAQTISKILHLFYIMYTARYLGAEGFGVLSFALAFTWIFSVFNNLGLTELTVREVARDKALAKKYIIHVTIMKTGLSILTFGLIALTINLLGYPAATVKVVYIIALSIMAGIFTQTFGSLFQAYEQMEYQSFGSILNSVVMFAGVIIAINSGFSVMGFAFLYLMANLVTSAYSLIVFRLKFSDWFSKRAKIDRYFWAPMIREALPFFLSSLVYIISFKIDIVMLSKMKGDIAVGWYSAAYRLLEFLIWIPATFTSAIYPVFSNFHVSSRESLKKAYQKSFKYLCIMSFPIAIGISILADRIILLIYKGDFSQSITALRVLVWTIPLIFVDYLFGVTLASINKQRLDLKIGFTCMLANIAMNMVLIPKYGIVGASVATIITTLVSVVICFWFLSNAVSRISIGKVIIKPVIAGTIMGLFIFSLIKVNLFLLISGSAVVYFTVLFILRTFSKEDRNLFKEIIAAKQKEAKI